ncbi:MAG: DnaB-like helicase N-terminal domain-containing protein, partial [Alphaproteobacteria bacterium]
MTKSETKNANNPATIRVDLSNVEAEQSVLGTIILNNEYLARVLEFLLPEHFYEPAHQKIY